MKLQKNDKIIVISGRDKGKKGEIVAVLPKRSQVIVEGINVVKRHTKPSQANPKGGIIEKTKPIDSSKVMVLDPSSGKPARVGYTIGKGNKKERIFKVSKFKNTTTSKVVKKDSKQKPVKEAKK
jgi:large subunit ribosomal protein L24